MSDDLRYMSLALEEAARASEEGEIPVGAVLVCAGRVIAAAHNRREQDQNALAHAEMLCIDAACRERGSRRLQDCTLYVTLEPCPMCAGAILNACLSRVVFGLPDAKSGCFGSVLQMNALPFHHRVALTAGICEGEAHRLMRDFFAARRKKGDTT